MLGVSKFGLLPFPSVKEFLFYFYQVLHLFHFPSVRVVWG